MELMMDFVIPIDAINHKPAKAAPIAR